MMHCFTCDRDFDPKAEDSADYTGSEPVCGDCVQAALDNQLQQTWQQLNNDEQAIKEFCNAG